MKPDPEMMPFVVGIACITVAVQVVLLVRMGRRSRSTLDALKSIPMLYLVSAMGSVLGVFGMFGAGLAFKVLVAVTLAGAALLLSLRYGVIDGEDDPAG